MDDDIARALWEFLRENCLPHHSEVKYSDDVNLFEKGIIDSAGVLAFVGFIEKSFGLSIPDEDLLPENFISVAAAASYIDKRRKTQLDDASSESDHV